MRHHPIAPTIVFLPLVGEPCRIGTVLNIEEPILHEFHTLPQSLLSVCQIVMPQHLALYRFTIIPKMDTELVHKILERDEAESAPPCFTGNKYDGRMGLRISSIFVILVGSIFGAVFPVVARRFGSSGIPS